MKKTTVCGLALMALVSGFSSSAQADLCKLNFKAHGGGLQLIFGKFKLHGTGILTCTDSYGTDKTDYVSITMGGHSPIALRASVGYFSLQGAVGEVRLGHSDAIYGEYVMAGAQAAIAVGAGVHAIIQNPATGISMSLNLSAIEGFGFDAGLKSLVIQPLDTQHAFYGSNTHVVHRH